MELACSRWPVADSVSKGEVVPRGPNLKRLVLLHGMGGTGALWRPLAATLEDQFDLLAPDQRGHGRSQISHLAAAPDRPSYSPLDYGRDLVETLAARQFSPAWIVGHSMGVRSALALHHLKPDWVRGLVLIDLGFAGPAGGGLGLGLSNFLHKLPTRFATRNEARDFMLTECPDSSIGQYLMAVSTKAPDGSVTFPFDHGALIATIQAARDVTVREWVREAGERGTPVLALRGANSGVWTAEEFARERTHFAEFPSIRFEEWEGAGHGLPFEKRAELASRLRALDSGS